MFAHLTRPLLDLLFPPRCLGCRSGLGQQEAWFCLECEETLPHFDNEPCDGNALCRKLWGRLPLGFGLALYQYQIDSPVQHLLHALKYHDRQEACRHFGRALGRLYREAGLPMADLVAFVPMHPAKLRRRGYNQAELIARGLSEETGIPLFTGLAKGRKTESQTRKGRAERMQNQQGAFALAGAADLAGKHVLLVDDVVTTGATLEQAAHPLLQAGAQTISIAAIANA